MTVAEVTERVAPLAKSLRSRNSNTAIVFVENIEYSKIFYEEATRKLIQDKNDALKSEFEKLQKSGMKNIHFISAKNAIGNDNEATVDGVHLTDLGYTRMATHLIKAFQKQNIRIKIE
jgi:lysophospholipase L1-like esterase